MSDRRDLLVGLVLLVLCASCALRTGPGNQVPARIPLTHAEPWMADALPGVGTKTRAAMAAALREGRITALPARAQAEVSHLFDTSSSAHTNDE